MSKAFKHTDLTKRHKCPNSSGPYGCANYSPKAWELHSKVPDVCISHLMQIFKSMSQSAISNITRVFEIAIGLDDVLRDDR